MLLTCSRAFFASNGGNVRLRPRRARPRASGCASIEFVEPNVAREVLAGVAFCVRLRAVAVGSIACKIVATTCLHHSRSYGQGTERINLAVHADPNRRPVRFALAAVDRPADDGTRDLQRSNVSTTRVRSAARCDIARRAGLDCRMSDPDQHIDGRWFRRCFDRPRFSSFFHRTTSPFHRRACSCFVMRSPRRRSSLDRDSAPAEARVNRSVREPGNRDIVRAPFRAQSTIGRHHPANTQPFLTHKPGGCALPSNVLLSSRPRLTPHAGQARKAPIAIALG
jgi:hypothetical protein